jgi:hypothetical protein
VGEKTSQCQSMIPGQWILQVLTPYSFEIIKVAKLKQLLNLCHLTVATAIRSNSTLPIGAFSTFRSGFKSHQYHLPRACQTTFQT